MKNINIKKYIADKMKGKLKKKFTFIFFYFFVELYKHAYKRRTKGWLGGRIKKKLEPFVNKPSLFPISLPTLCFNISK